MRKYYQINLILFLLLFICGCATHPARVHNLKNDLAYGNGNASRFINKNYKPSEKNGVLNLLERFRYQQLIANFTESSDDFMLLHEFDLKYEEEHPQIAFSDLLRQGGATILNDNILPYRMSDFERVMLYQLQIFNNLAGTKENILPLVNNLTIHQQRIRDSSAVTHIEREKEINRSSNKTVQEAWNNINNNQDFQRLNSENLALANKLSSIENAYAYYFCGIFFENRAQLGDALIAYESALRLQPTNKFFQRDFARVALALNKKDELKKYSLNFQPQQSAANDGEVIVFFEEGYIPEKFSFKLPPLPIPTAHGILFVNVAFPYYLPSQNRQIPLNIRGNNVQVNTELAADLRNLAVKNLSDQMPEIMSRMILRAVIRNTANYALLKGADKIDDPAQRKFSKFLLHLQQLVQHSAEEPDLRSWLMLPHFTQVARFSLAPGKHQLQVAYANAIHNIELEVFKGKKTILHCMAVPGRFTYSSSILPKNNWR